MLKRQAGFTLIEITLVLAISSMLAVIVFAGQRALRSRTQFDSDVNQVVATIADARNQAVAGINIEADTSNKGGTGKNGCPSGKGDATFAGVLWAAAPSGAFTEDYYKSNTDIACTFEPTKTLSYKSGLKATVAGGSVQFVRRVQDGALVVCRFKSVLANPSPLVKTLAQGGVCGAGVVPAGTMMTLTFQDADGHSSQVQIEGSGLARRMN